MQQTKYTGLKEFPTYDLHPVHKRAEVGEYVLLHPSVDIGSLTQPAIQLLGFVFKNMEAGQVKLNIQELKKKYNKVSPTTIYSAIAVLLTEKILFRKDKEHYWVNQSKLTR